MPALQGKVSLEHKTNQKDTQQGVHYFVYLKFYCYASFSLSACLHGGGGP